MPLIAERPPLPQSENALAVLWAKSHTLEDGITAQDGRQFRVLYPGRPNHSAGPDFLDAIILNESGKVVTGDIELHMRAPDWYSHGHSTDPNYNGVVLHVVLYPKGESHSTQSSEIQVPVVSLEPAASRQHHASASAIPETFHSAFKDAEDVGQLLDRAGDRRFLAKSQGFTLEMQAEDPDQIIYRALLEALGYSANRKPFRVLAEKVPFSLLQHFSNEPSSTRHLALKALLMSASGLIEYLSSEEQTAVKRFRKCLPQVKPMQASQWKLFRVRPSNHPIMRIQGATIIVDAYLDYGLSKGLGKDLMDGGTKNLTRKLAVRPFIGESRARDMMVNVVLPFLHAYGEIQRTSSLSQMCLDSYHSFPKLQENEITREMARLLKIDASVKINARRQQGMIQLYKKFTKQTMG